MNKATILDNFFPRLATFDEDSFPDKKFPLLLEKDDRLTITEERIGTKYVVQQLTKTHEISFSNGEKFPISKVEYFIKDAKIVKDMGVFYSNYAEFIIHIDWETISKKFFTIDNLEVYINNQPTLLFKAAHYDLTYDDGYLEDISSDSLATISLKGENLTQENLEDSLSKALFLLGYYDKDKEFYRHYPSFFEYKDYYAEEFMLSETSIFKERQLRNNIEFNSMHFSNIDHPTAIRFYNAGMQIKDKEISFQYFYKVLEYFWTTARKEKFKLLISDYNSEDNIDNLFINVQEVFSNNEGNQLRILLESIKEKVDKLTYIASTKKYAKKNSIKEFCKSLYEYRNSVVHGKNEKDLNLKLPSIWENEKEKFWIESTRQISEILIEKYCLHIK